MIYDGDYDLDDLRPTCEKTAHSLRAIRDQFDVILCTGMSGVVVGVPVSLALGVPCVILRKPDDDAHQSRGTIAGFTVINRHRLFGKRAVIVDDFGSSGDTEKRLMLLAKNAEAKVVATYWYHHDEVVHHGEPVEELPECAPLPEQYACEPYKFLPRFGPNDIPF